jgi:hypothetical protein
MSILSRCSVLGCRTLTIGDVCLVHDRRPLRAFVRGRPFVAPVLSERFATIPVRARASFAAGPTTTRLD